MPLSTEKPKLYTFYTWNGDITDLLSLKQVENNIPEEFYINFEGEWDINMLGSLTRLFHDFYKRGIKWQTFCIVFHNNPANDKFIKHILFTANKLSLFKEFRFEYLHEEAKCFPGAELNNRLEAIKIDFEEPDGEEPNHFGDFQSLGQLLQTSTTLKSLSLSNIKTFDHETFSEGLAVNVSLEELIMVFSEVECDITDEGLSTIITSLRANTSFRELHLYTKGQVGTMTSQALNTLLRCSTSLTNLKWWDLCSVEEYGTSIVDQVLQGLKQNRSLRNLDYNVDDSSLPRLFDALRDCATLETLYFTSGGQSSGDSPFLPRLFDAVRECATLQKVGWFSHDEHAIVDELNQISNMARLSRPIDLIVWLEKTRGWAHAAKRLLDSHPEIRLHLLNSDWGSLCDRDLKEYCQEYCIDFEHSFKFNQHGRYLLDRPHFPMPMWPLVLEKANSEESILYEFLKGPPLAARHNFDHNNSEQSKAKRPRVA